MNKKTSTVAFSNLIGSLIFLAIGVVIGGVGGVNAIRNYLKV